MMLRVTALAVLDTLGALLRRRPILIPTAAAPGSVGLMTAPDCLPGYLAIADAAAREAGFDNRVTARTALDIARYAPGRRTKRITCATLFALCQTDTVAPAKTAQRQASHTQHGEIRLYPAGHFDIYLGDWFETNVTDQLAFLTSHVPVND
jgi:pimeloyl-ACP methyl ester carboxylesterase